MNTSQPLHDVVIAGAGPVGLFLSCELRLAGVSVLVLEQADVAHTPLKQLPFGLRGLSAPSIEAFYRRGLLDELAARDDTDAPPANAGASAGPHWMQQTRRPGGHFAGIPFFHDRIDSATWSHRLPGPAGTPMATTMEHVESVLAARATAMGVDIRRGLGVHEFAQSDDGVTVGAGEDLVHGRWLVGCDGGRSVVRKLGGFAFVGTDPEFTGYSVAVEIADPVPLTPGRHYTATGMYSYERPGTIAMVDFDGGACHRRQPLTLDHVQAVLRRVSGMQVTITALHLATTWTDRAYQATDYRKGRVLLTGDAAHIHSPLGGQGLNLGLGDALNLGWKLAATVRGEAPAGLLDSYVAERHPIGAQVLDWSRAQVAIMRPSRSSRALEAIFRDLIETTDGARYFAERVWGTRLRYDLCSSHPLVGASVPDFAFADGSRLGSFLTNGKGVLLDIDTSAPFAKVHGAFKDRITYIARDVTERLGVSAVLVRPDGIVAWVAVDGAPDFAEAASRWFGTPDR